MVELKEWLNSINSTKENLIDNCTTEEKDYPPYIINKCLSGFKDTVFIANEMNLSSHLDNKLQYDFFINIVRPRKRFSPWIRKEKTRIGSERKPKIAKEVPLNLGSG